MFFEIVTRLCAKKGISITQLALELKISRSNVTNWKNGSVPKIDKVQEIASYFNVTTDYLLGNEQKNNSLPELTDKEHDILDLFRGLDIERQDAFLRFLKGNK